MPGRRDLLLLVSGMGLSAVGTHVTFIALPLHLKDRGPLVISGLLMASLIPVALGGPLAGWLVDRFPNRRLLVLAQLLAAAATGGMLLALDTLPVLFCLIAMVGAAAAVTSPAMAALMPALTGEQDAIRGYSALGMARSVGALGGLALGGVLATGPGVQAALALDTATFLVLAAALATLRAERTPDAGGSSGGQFGQALAGLRWLAADRVLLAAVTGLSVAALLAVLVNVAEVYFVTDVLHGSGVAFGVIAAAWAAGMLIGSKLAARLTTERQQALWLLGCGIGLGAALVAPAAVPLVSVNVVAWLAGGMFNAAQNVAIQGLVRARVPQELRGRAFAGTNSALVTATVLGTFVGGAATGELGPRLVFTIAGLGTAITATVALLLVLPLLPERVDSVPSQGARPAQPPHPQPATATAWTAQSVPALPGGAAPSDRMEIPIITVMRTPAAGAEPPRPAP